MQDGRGPAKKAKTTLQEKSAAHGHQRREAAALCQSRKQLPIWPHLPEIRRQLKQKDILLLVGETGSGKSTQVPQCLVSEPWCRSKVVNLGLPSGGPQDVSVGGCIAVTEPRRVAAISLAHRVAAEMGTTLGSSSPASKVGYSVRFDNSTSPSMRIKFLTDGMLLQEILRDPWLCSYSAIVVDEIHERGVNVDLLIGFLQKLVTGNFHGRGGVPLKLVVMSASADLASLESFFRQRHCQPASSTTLARIEANGDSGLENGSKTEDTDSSWSGLSDSENNELGRTKNQLHVSEDAENNIGVCIVKGRQYPVMVEYQPEPVSDLIECALHKIFEIHYGEAMPGDVLVFLTGQEDIESLENLIREYALQMAPDVPKVQAFLPTVSLAKAI